MRTAAFLTTFFLIGSLAAAESPEKMTWKVGDDSREAIVFVPADARKNPSPVVFAFHGHGGTARHAAATFALQKLWPEAIVVYMQGLNTPGKLTDPEGKKSGWQSSIGDQKDRDLKFFDDVLKSLKENYQVDEKRIYSTGHSNGGGFTYLLWAARGDVFAAVAPSAAIPSGGRFKDLKPKPVMHIAGEKDDLVKYAWQERAMKELRKLNDTGEGKEGDKYCTVYESRNGTPVVTFIHPGDHKYPVEAPAAIVKFFKEQAKK